MSGFIKTDTWMAVGFAIETLANQWKAMRPEAALDNVVPKEIPLPPSPEAIASMARSYLRLRRKRERHSPGLFFDPAWDILLDLFAASVEGRDVSVSSACIASSVPATTALRHIDRLRTEGYIARFSDPRDGRRIFVSITERGRQIVGEFLINLHAH